MTAGIEEQLVEPGCAPPAWTAQGSKPLGATTGELAPLRTAESIAASSRTAGIRARARSMIVRVADVHRKPFTVTTSGGPSASVVWTTNGTFRPRPTRGIVNSTTSGRHRSKAWRRAAASWLTAAVDPRHSRPLI